MDKNLVRHVKPELKQQILDTADRLREHGMVDAREVAYEVASQNGELKQQAVGQRKQPPPELIEVVSAVLEEEW